VEQSPALMVADNQVIYNAADVEAGDYYYSFRLNNSAGNGLLADTLKTRQLPITRLTETFPRKTLKKYRQYIAALIIRMSSPYPIHIHAVERGN
jgi:hypothetical protein